MANDVPDVIVVGAGIIGAACAYWLSRRKKRVLIIDSRPVGSFTSSRGMGHVVLMDDDQARLALTGYSRRLWHEMAAVLPVESEFNACGTLWVAEDEEERTLVERKHAICVRSGIESSILDASDLKRAEPNLHRDLRGGLLVPGDCIVNPPRVAQWLVEQTLATGTGAQAMIGFKVASIIPRGGAIQARGESVDVSVEGSLAGIVLRDGRVISAHAVVNACGVLSPELTAGLPVRPRKGHLVLTEPAPGFCNHQIVELGYIKHAHEVEADSVAFNIEPRREWGGIGAGLAAGADEVTPGAVRMLIGSSRQYDSETEEIEPAVVERMMARAERFMPAIRSLRPALVRTGFRPATGDALPIIGPHPGQPGVFLATGHEGLGITTSLGTGAMIADMVCGEATAIDAGPYSAARFGI